MQLEPRIKNYTKRNKRSSIWKKIVTGLSCIVVFCTTYALILPAITMEKPVCGLPEHTHNMDCYRQVDSGTSGTAAYLACTMETLGCHVHTEDCYAEDGSVICGFADYVVHTHNEYCYDADGNLVCTLPEIEAHAHTDECYAQTQSASASGHVHTDACYTDVRAELICTLPETTGHVHDASCYPEGTMTEESLIDEEDQSVSGGTAPICGLMETQGHTHDDSCYMMVQVLSCGYDDVEVTSAEPELICTKPEIKLHTHTEDCYETIEDEDGEEIQILTCTEMEVLEHQHTDACFLDAARSGEEILTCPLTEDENHKHTELCYGTWELICGMKEHQHTDACLPDHEDGKNAEEEEHIPSSLSNKKEPDDGDAAETQSEPESRSEETENETAAEDRTEEVGTEESQMEATEGESETSTEKTTETASEGESETEASAVEAVTEESQMEATEGESETSTEKTTETASEGESETEASTVEAVTEEAQTEESETETESLTAQETETEELGTESETKSESESEIMGETETEDESETETETEDESETETETEDETETENESEIESETETENETEAEDGTETENFSTTVSGNGYAITVSYTDTAQIPEDAELTAEEILPGDVRYETYLSQLQAEEDILDASASFADSAEEQQEETQETARTPEEISYFRVFDLQFTLDGQEIQPEDAVEVAVMLEYPISADWEAALFAADGASVYPAVSADQAADGTTALTFTALTLTDTAVFTRDDYSLEDLQRVRAVIEMINALPYSHEIRERLAEYDSADDQQSYEAYLEQVSSETGNAYARYTDLGEELQSLVTNADKLMSLSWLWEDETSAAVLSQISVYKVNVFVEEDQDYPEEGIESTTLVHGGTVEEVVGTTYSFREFDAVVVEADDQSGELYVADYISDESDKRDLEAATDDGFVLLLDRDSVTADTVVGNIGTVSFDYQDAEGYDADSFGVVTFGVTAAVKAAKDNESKLDTVNGEDTRDLIEINLYDYGTNINDKYKSDKKYPGFQQDGGTNTTVKTSGNNFGNNITSDLANMVKNVTNNGGAINATYHDADGTVNINRPITGAMLSTLGSDGYPALADKTSLAYLFTNNTYAKKLNSQSINGLFQYNKETGAYTFDSRKNHAQYNAGSDTFTLYKQLITSNFAMYPFGNFLPMNDIVHQSAQTSTIDKAYLQTIANSAQYKYNNGKGDAYKTLASAMDGWISVMDQNYGSNWKAWKAIEAYFSANGIDSAAATNTALLDKLYSIDYDEETDFFFGMEMKMTFIQPKDGLTGNDSNGDGVSDYHMVFEFTGDDDVWVYVDGKLFLDLSGIHRHVGGTIDFTAGKVYYYGLDKATGEVGTTPYNTVTFEQLLGSREGLSADGAFEDYSSHTFQFYYMERGAGSSVCRMNFNFPLLRENSISVSKEVSKDTEIEPLGNPDYEFQVLKAEKNETKTEELFLAPGTAYTLYDAENNVIGSGETDDNGIFRLKAGQRAEFDVIKENSGKYYVRELLENINAEQYGQITVSGGTTTTNYDVVIDGTTFTGVESPVKDISDGSTTFYFDNKLDTSKLGKLQVSKVLNTYPQTRAASEFAFEVKLDGEPLPEGTVYKITKSDGTETGCQAEAGGIIRVSADASALISNIIAGSKFEVTETSDSAQGYVVSYETGDEVTTDSAKGFIKTEISVEAIITNNEQGISLDIPVQKTLENSDGKTYAFTFALKQVADKDGTPLETEGEMQTRTVELTDSAQTVFTLNYLEKDITELPVCYYYEITETTDEAQEDLVAFDKAVYIAEVTVSDAEDGSLQAELTGIWKDGDQQSADAGQQSAGAENQDANLQTLDIEVGKPDADAQGIVFTNRLVRSLTLKKQIAGKANDKTFPFQIVIKQDGSPLTGTYRVTTTDENGFAQEEKVTLDEKGALTVRLGHGKACTVHGLPDGVAWEITETEPSGYQVTWQYEDKSIQVKKNTASGTLSSQDQSVVCINVIGYQMPETGGIGTNLYTMTGLLMTASAAGLLYKRKKRREGE